MCVKNGIITVESSKLLKGNSLAIVKLKGFTFNLGVYLTLYICLFCVYFIHVTIILVNVIYIFLVIYLLFIL